LLERRQPLHARIASGPRLQLIQHVVTHGEGLFRAIAGEEFEGLVAKRVDAPYRAERQPAWLKIKNCDYSRRGAVEWQGR
jgi:bifunctional non-homologous end joining protein LigD